MNPAQAFEAVVERRRVNKPPFRPRRAAATAESAAARLHFRRTGSSQDINLNRNASGDSPAVRKRAICKRRFRKMAFTTCERCGCKAIVAGLACVCAFAAVHPIEDRCWDKGPDHQILMYCNQVAVHPAHGPHHDHPSVPAERTIAVVSSTSANGTLYWQGGRLPGGQR
jgi:hypothetical protein